MYRKFIPRTNKHHLTSNTQFSSSTSYFINIILVLSALFVYLLTAYSAGEQLLSLGKTSPSIIVLFSLLAKQG